MEYDYNKLLGKIKEKYGSNKKIASILEISEKTFCEKINNKVDFKQSEIEKICNLLEINNNEIKEYFFTKKVQEN